MKSSSFTTGGTIAGNLCIAPDSASSVGVYHDVLCGIAPAKASPKSSVFRQKPAAQRTRDRFSGWQLLGAFCHSMLSAIPMRIPCETALANLIAVRFWEIRVGRFHRHNVDLPRQTLRSGVLTPSLTHRC